MWRVFGIAYRHRTEPKLRNTGNTYIAKYRIRIGIDRTARLQPCLIYDSLYDTIHCNAIGCSLIEPNSIQYNCKVLRALKLCPKAIPKAAFFDASTAARIRLKPSSRGSRDLRLETEGRGLNNWNRVLRPLYYTYNPEPPKNGIGNNYVGPLLLGFGGP